LAKEYRAIHLLVHDTANSKNIIVSGIYGPTQAREKDVFWEQLLHMNSIVDLPWLLVGDFNELESLTDKQGTNLPSLRRTEWLNSLLSIIRAESIPVNGKHFSWGKRINSSWVFERLDGGIAREDCSSLYPNLCLTYVAFMFSDHCPIIISTTMENRQCYSYCNTPNP